MHHTLDTAGRCEAERIPLQVRLDGGKGGAERNRLGQFATPPALAREVVRAAAAHLSDGPVRLLEPAAGTGAFFSAAAAELGGRLKTAVGYEVDSHYGEPAARLWSFPPFDYRLGDFTRQDAPDRPFDLLLSNPPYVRHHHLGKDEKRRLALRTRDAVGVSPSGLAGLYVHFLLQSHAWLADGGVSAWLIPSEFMDVNYGREVKRYLLEKVRLLHVHRFDPADVQFGDALVSSAVVIFRKTTPGGLVRFSLGGGPTEPRAERSYSVAELAAQPKWSRFPDEEARGECEGPVLGDFFSVKRGTATGDNDFFVMTEAEAAGRGIPHRFLTPVLPRPADLHDPKIDADADGRPNLDGRKVMLTCDAGEEELRKDFPAVWSYLESGRRGGTADRYICKHRSPWYHVKPRKPAPILCSYMSRKEGGRGFRFFRNRSRATSTNVLLFLEPKPAFDQRLGSGAAREKALDDIWRALAAVPPEELTRAGRVYGGGLHKLEPRELMALPLGKHLLELLHGTEVVAPTLFG